MRHIWWRSVFLSENQPIKDLDHMPLVHRARNARDHVELADSLVELAKKAHESDIDHPIHQHLRDVIVRHAKRNPKMLNDALSHIARGPHGTIPHTAPLHTLLEYTPTEHAAKMIGHYVSIHPRDALHTALAWLHRHPHLHEHFRDHILPHLDEHVDSYRRRGRISAYEPYIPLIKSDYERLSRNYNRAGE